MSRFVRAFSFFQTAYLLAFPAFAVPARSIPVTVNGVDYTITTLGGSYNDNVVTLQSQIWWNNSSLARQFAD
jgi:hypothetical protein